MDICTHGPDYFKRFLRYLRPPIAVEKIPVYTTEPIPLRSMTHHNSTIDGNLKAIEDSLKQAGVWNLEDLAQEQMLPGLEEMVIFFYGDLGTWERIQSAQMHRSIEDTSRDRLQFLIFIPGLFHVKIACADALWRIFISPKELKDDQGSMLSFINIFFPKLTSKIRNNKAGFRVLNDCITRVGVSDRLECWRTYIQERWPDCTTLEEFAEQRPSAQEIDAISRELALKYGSANMILEEYKEASSQPRDHQFENSLIRIAYILLYEELAFSIRSGDVGRIESCLARWIPIFKATGKHKYAAHLLQFLTDVHFVYPEGLRKAVRYNWLCNPTGKPMGFRGVDWLLELSNLYTKVIYGGSSSNYTVQRIITESVLIQLYQDCKNIVEQQFLLNHKTTRHGDPELTSTYAAMSRLAQAAAILQFRSDRKAKYLIPNYIHAGITRYNSEAVKTNHATDGALQDDIVDDELTQEDLEVDDNE